MMKKLFFITLVTISIINAADLCHYTIDGDKKMSNLKGMKNCKEISITFTDGIFVLKKPISIETDVALGISIQGNGLRNTRLLVLNKEGAFHIRTTKRNMSVQIQNLSIYSKYKAAEYAIKIEQPPRGNQHRRNVILRDLEISNYKNKLNFYFKNAIVLNGTWRPLIDDVLVSGFYGNKKNKIYPAMDTCFLMNDVYSPTVTNSRCWRAKTGLMLTSQKNPGPEGIMIDHCKFVQNVIGIEIYTKGIEPEGFITNSHVNAWKTGIKVTNRKYLHISGNLLYRNRYSDKEYTDIEFIKTNYSIVDNNIFHYPQKKTKGKRIHVDLSDSHHNIIKNNLATKQQFSIRGNLESNIIRNNYK